MRRHHNRAYEYEYGHSDSGHYREKIRRKPHRVLLDGILFFLVIPLPIFGAVLELTKVAFVPTLWLAVYAAIAQTVAGLLFLILTACGVGGFGKIGYFFTHTHGKRWMSSKEAKGNTYLFGFIMLIIGLLCILWTIKLL